MSDWLSWVVIPLMHAAQLAPKQAVCGSETPLFWACCVTMPSAPVANKKLISFVNATPGACPREDEKKPTPEEMMAVSGLEASFASCMKDLKACAHNSEFLIFVSIWQLLFIFA